MRFGLYTQNLIWFVFAKTHFRNAFLSQMVLNEQVQFYVYVNARVREWHDSREKQSDTYTRHIWFDSKQSACYYDAQEKKTCPIFGSINYDLKKRCDAFLFLLCCCCRDIINKFLMQNNKGIFTGFMNLFKCSVTNSIAFVLVCVKKI